MKRTQVWPGRNATLRVGRKRIPVYVAYHRYAAYERGNPFKAQCAWCVVAADGKHYDATPRMLRLA